MFILNIYYEIRMNWLNLVHTLTNTQVTPARKGVWSLGKLIITLLKNLQHIPMGPHPCVVKGVSHRPHRQPHRPKPQLGEVLSSPEPSALSKPHWLSRQLLRGQPSPQLCKTPSAPHPLGEQIPRVWLPSPAGLGKQLIWHLLNLPVLQQGRYLWL